MGNGFRVVGISLVAEWLKMKDLRKKLVFLKLADEEGFVELGVQSFWKKDGSFDWLSTILTVVIAVALLAATLSNLAAIFDYQGCVGCLEKYCPFNASAYSARYNATYPRAPSTLIIPSYNYEIPVCENLTANETV